MYSSEDLERFYFQYQTEALPHGESLQSFCVKNKVLDHIRRILRTFEIEPKVESLSPITYFH